MRATGKKIAISSLVLSLLFSSAALVFAQSVVPTISDTPSPTDTQTVNNSQVVNDLNNKIKDLKEKVDSLKNQESTLNSQIQVMDNQIKLTEYRVNATQAQITDLSLDIDSATKRMKNLEGSLNDVTKVLINRIVATYETGSVKPIQVLLASNDVSDFFTRSNYLKVVQEHDKRLIYDTQQAKNDYANQKAIFENKKKKIVQLKAQLEDYTKQLDKQKDDKKRLLADTQGSEATYEKLLSEARAQLAGFSRFTASQGGASLLSNQTACDDWGCYYNQRDSQWGGVALNNTRYSIASDGCLITSMAMVYTHFGHKSVTPLTINSNPNNFASYEPAWLKKSIVADGTPSTRVTASIDSELNSGNPVIVGISYDGGPLPDHFLVLVSGSGGNYKMNDPYTPNGHNIPFTSHYSVGSIREIERVQM